MEFLYILNKQQTVTLSKQRDRKDENMNRGPRVVVSEDSPERQLHEFLQRSTGCRLRSGGRLTSGYRNPSFVAAKKIGKTAKSAI